MTHSLSGPQALCLSPRVSTAKIIKIRNTALPVLRINALSAQNSLLSVANRTNRASRGPEDENSRYRSADVR